ncbi:MAG: ABC transporter substrate-binding protein [Treponema sp. GWB1_62_6]|nr:MAG: ABC transporter substrate-binding protein [Treponema sp. GWA1_62_8]OHE64173.1 MAG: ABC transporter substrate-binding protein [Treponema sp. GWC1_61_84]OHE68801.1 MAG: ABC transporter substrate-binding protein [Treponema sp. GWB1_62_6]HCM28924.1 ABC transporter substrate-binding protein [Treponema sp.]
MFKEEEGMRRIKAAVCIGLLFSFVLFSATAEGAKEAPAQQGKTVLKWALWDLAATTYYTPLIAAYEAAHPDVKIETLDLGSTDYMTMLSTQLTGGDDSIDVCTVKDIPGYSNLVKAGQLLPLNDYISKSKIDTSVYGGITDQISVDGKVFALPFRSDFWIVYYNKDLFDRAGVAYPTNDMSLTQYAALARKMTSGKGADKVYGSHFHTWRSAVQLFGILDGKQTIVDGNYDFLKPYYAAILAQQKDGICQDYATLKTSSTHYSGVFYNNSVAMMNMGSWFISTLIAKIEKGETQVKNWGIVKYPHPDGVPAGTTLGTITTLGVSAASKKQAAALDFVKFVSGTEGAAIIAKTGTIPAIRTNEIAAIIAAKPGFPADANSKGALQVTKTYLEMPMHPKSAEIEVVLNQNHDNIMTNNVNIDEGIARMNKDVAKILGR